MNLRRFDFSTIDSTNLEAKRRWDSPLRRAEAAAALREGARPAWLFVAREQTAGRGRLGKLWGSPRGGLWFTLLWPLKVEPEHLEGVSLAVGLAVAEAIQVVVCLDCELKWPNDLLIKERKLAGILCELDVRPDGAALIVGVGINVNLAVTDLPVTAEYGATTILEEIGQEVDLEHLLQAALCQLFDRLVSFESNGLTQMKQDLNDRLAWRDQTVTLFETEGGPVSGTLIGIDDTGRLVLDCGGKARTFLSGELRRAVS